MNRISTLICVVSSIVIAALSFGKAAAQQQDTTLKAPPDEYRHFIMPTAKPISGGYVGFWELAFLQAGYGFGDFLSISGGITLMPTVSTRSQFAYLQAKATLADENGVSFAVGGNLLRMTSEHLYLHAFLEATAEMQNEMRYTAMIFYKASGEDYPVVNVIPYGNFSFSYGSSLGAGIGFDIPIKGIPNTRFIAEAWNHDLSTPSKLALLGAVRIEGERFSSDFGFMYFSLPMLAPVANFAWRF